MISYRAVWSGGGGILVISYRAVWSGGGGSLVDLFLLAMRTASEPCVVFIF